MFISKFDPTGQNLLFSTYLGGSRREIAEAVAVDAAGNITVVGETYSFDFPLSEDPFQDEINIWAGDDGFVTKLRPTGDSLVFSTFMSADSDVPSFENIRDVAVDAHGNVYLTGDTTDPSWPVTEGAYRTTGCEDTRADAFVSKLASTGKPLLYSTYLCGDAIDYGRAIAVDSTGHAIVAGSTGSTDFPVMEGMADDVAEGGIWVTKLAPDGGSLLFSHLIGGEDWEFPTAIALRGDDEIHVVGKTTSHQFPVTMNAAQSVFGGDSSCRDSPCGDAFHLKLDGSGTIRYATYLGGRNGDRAEGVAVDEAGTVFIVGTTDSTDFLALQPLGPYGDDVDAFLAALSSSGRLFFSTTLGGAEIDEGMAVAAGLEGAVVVGKTASFDFPVAAAFDGEKSAGDTSDIFVALIRVSPPSGRRRPVRRP